MQQKKQVKDRILVWWGGDSADQFLIQQFKEPPFVS